jgi:hypothetical protein
MGIYTGKKGVAVAINAFDPSNLDKDQKKKISNIIFEIKKARHIQEWDEIQKLVFAPFRLLSNESQSNIRRGDFSNERAEHAFYWIRQHHPDISVEIAPELFGTDTIFNWAQFLKIHAVNEGVSVYTKPGLGLLTHRSEAIPIGATLNLDEDFCFEINALTEGALLCLEGFDTNWFPVPLGENGEAILTEVYAGAQIIPYNPETREPLYLCEQESKGIHEYVFMIGPRDFLKDAIKSFLQGIAIPYGVLSRLGIGITNQDQNQCAIMRYKLRFKA